MHATRVEWGALRCSKSINITPQRGLGEVNGDNQYELTGIHVPRGQRKGNISTRLGPAPPNLSCGWRQECLSKHL